MLAPQEIKELSTLNPVKSYLALLGDYLFLFFLFTVGILFPNPWVIFLLMPLIARTQLAMAIIMHDGAHRRLHPSPKISDWISQALVAGPIAFSAESYKKNHLLHHKIPLTKEDPDLSLIAGYPIGSGSFFRKILRDLSGLSYFKFIKYFLYSGHKRALKLNESRTLKGKGEVKTSKIFLVSSIGVSNLLLIGFFFAFDRPWFYFFLWVLPAWTWLQFFLRIRGIAEHSGYEANSNQALCSRTVVNPLQAFFVAPHNVNYHIEHHLYVGIPFYNLPQAHKILKARGSLPEKNCYTSYFQVLKELVQF